MTKAKSAKGVNLAVKGSGDSWTVFHEVSSVPEIGQSADKIDVTSLESEMKEYVADIPDFSSDLEFTMNAIPTGEDTSNYDAIQELEPDSVQTWRVQYPQIGIECTLDGEFKWRMGGAEVSSKQDLILTIIPHTAPTWAAISTLSTLTYMEPDSEPEQPEGTA